MLPKIVYCNCKYVANFIKAWMGLVFPLTTVLGKHFYNKINANSAGEMSSANDDVMGISS